MAVRDLVGVLEDGSTLDPSVPENARRALKMTQGSTLVVRVAVVRLSGDEVNLSDGPAQLWMTIKRRATQDAADMTISGSLAPTVGQNVATFSISPTATKYLTPGRYAYDVWMEHPGGRDVVLPVSPFYLEPGLQLP